MESAVYAALLESRVSKWKAGFLYECSMQLAGWSRTKREGRSLVRLDGEGRTPGTGRRAKEDGLPGPARTDQSETTSGTGDVARAT